MKVYKNPESMLADFEAKLQEVDGDVLSSCNASTTITAAAKEGDSKLMFKIDEIDEDIDFLLAALEQVDKAGNEQSQQGLEIATTFHTALLDAISQASNILAKGEQP